MRRAFACLLLVVFATSSLAACGDSGSEKATTEATQGESDNSHFEGGEKSIEGFGSEAKGADREAILSAEQAYLNALAAPDYAAACFYLAGGVHRSLRQLAPKQLKAEGCRAILPRLLSPSAATTARQQAEGKITKVRVEGDRAFVVFHAPGAKLYLFPMAREGNSWKTTTAAASVLVPSQATMDGR